MSTAAAVQPVTVACRELSYSIKKKQILHDVNFLAEPSKLLIIVGPSGAGKTTLINNIAFRIKNGTPSGQITFNGQQASAREFREVCNYVMTHGRMLPYVTVFETLMTAANLKLPHFSNAEKIDRVEKVMLELGLKKCRDTYIGGEWKKGISTGEKKRVFIAIELLSEPSVLILDEPTNGLDSTLASELLGVLQRLASIGRTIICSIHQPTSQMWSQFDQLILLSRGSVVYHGKASATRDYFARHGFSCPKNYNPADFFLNLITESDDDGTVHESLFSEANSTAEASDISLKEAEFKEMEKGYMTSKVEGSHLTMLLNSWDKSKEKENLMNQINQWHSDATKRPQRSFTNSIRNPVVCCVMLLVQALQGMILGGIFWQVTSDIAYQNPYMIDTKAILDNPWLQLFIHGIDGHQPILDALENGVDGNGSQPLLLLFNDQESINWVADVVTCATQEMSLNTKKQHYPDFQLDERSPQLNLKNATDPYIVARTFIKLLQMSDKQYRHVDWSFYKKNLNDPTVSDAYWWATLTAAIQDDLLDPFFGCAGYPTFRSRNSKKKPKKRKLITIGDTGIEDAMMELLGIGSADFVAALKKILDRLRTCTNFACEWIGQKYAEVVNLGQDSFSATMAVVNILGALFFAVSNLGFSSYDALLTFPQERVLFNRESANGFYKPSSYFLAKNLADFPFQIIPSFILVTIYYLCLGLGGSFKQYIIYIIVCSGITFAAYGFGYFVSAVSPRLEIAVLIAPVVLVIWLTIAGFFLRDEQIPRWISWLSYISFYKWGFFALVTNQFPPDKYFGLMANKIPLLMAGITETRLWLTTSLLYVLGLGYRLAAFIALKYTNRQVGLQ